MAPIFFTPLKFFRTRYLMNRNYVTPKRKLSQKGDKKSVSNKYYLSLMGGFSARKMAAKGPNDKNIPQKNFLYSTSKISEEVNILGNQKAMTEKLDYNKYYWNFIALSESVKTLPQHKKGSYFENMSKQDVQKHFSKAKSVCNIILSKMEQLYLSSYSKTSGGGKKRMKSFRDYLQKNESPSENSENQFTNFIKTHYMYKEWSQQNKKSRLVREDRKWLKILRNGGMEEYFKQKVCEDHFVSVFNIVDYPIQVFLGKFLAHIKQTLRDMEQGMFCNVDRLIKDIKAVPDAMIDAVIDGYRTQLKGIDKHNFPLKVMKETLWGAILTEVRLDFIPLFRKFQNVELEKKITKLRKYLFLERLPIDERLCLPHAPVPYIAAIRKFSEIPTKSIIGDQMRIVEECFNLIFQEIDRYYNRYDRNLVGMKVKDTDMSLIVLYIILNCDIYCVTSWMEYMREFKDVRQNYPVFYLFDDILKFVDEITIRTFEDKQKMDDDNIVDDSVMPPVIPMRSIPKKRSTIVGGMVSRGGGRVRGRGRGRGGGRGGIMMNPRDLQRVKQMQRDLQNKNVEIERLEREVFSQMQNVRRDLKLPLISENAFFQT